jgi:hypothetical protein
MDNSTAIAVKAFATEPFARAIAFFAGFHATVWSTEGRMDGAVSRNYRNCTHDNKAPHRC